MKRTIFDENSTFFFRGDAIASGDLKKSWRIAKRDFSEFVVFPTRHYLESPITLITKESCLFRQLSEQTN